MCISVYKNTKHILGLYMCIYSYICKCIVKWFTITNQIRNRDYLREESANESFSFTSILWIQKWKYILSITNAIKNNCWAGRAILIRLLQKLLSEWHRCSCPVVWWKQILRQSIGSSGGFWCLSFLRWSEHDFLNLASPTFSLFYISPIF